MAIPAAPVCEHGYQLTIREGAVRHMATNGVCIENDALWRDGGKATGFLVTFTKPLEGYGGRMVTDPALLMDAIEAEAEGAPR